MMKAKRGGIMLPLFFALFMSENRGNIKSFWCDAFGETIVDLCQGF